MNTNVYVVDEIMGAGKSTAAINYINGSEDERFIVITPYLDEVERYKRSCAKKNFKEPIQNNGRKMNDIKELIRAGENIVCTHALFQRFDDEVISLCRILGYTLIMDEVAEVVQEYEITKDDIDNLLENYCEIGTNGLVNWREDRQDYRGKFEEVKNLCNLGGLAVIRDKALVWLFPVEVFKAFSSIYILTYMFGAQLQKYYYDYYRIEYRYLHIAGNDSESYTFSEQPGEFRGEDYSRLIHIVDNEKLNLIGEAKTALSVAWYIKYKDTAIMKQLQNNITNFFRNIRADNSKDNIWTTFKDYKTALSGKGYTRGFVPLNMRATNSYRERTSLAYPVNRFLNPMIKGFFQDHGVSVDEDAFAVSEMLQWIWRSAIRDGKGIWIYIPSSRMRNLLRKWIVDNSGNVNLNIPLDK